jgi:translation initiation factor 1
MVQIEPVVVRFERTGRSGKSVTIVSGVRLHPDGKTALLAALKKRLGAGGAVKEGALEIQGDQRERLSLLLPTLGYRVTRGN